MRTLERKTKFIENDLNEINIANYVTMLAVSGLFTLSVVISCIM